MRGKYNFLCAFEMIIPQVYVPFQAYLSLPEGISSVVGLIAMMTDHYNVLVGWTSSSISFC